MEKLVDHIKTLTSASGRRLLAHLPNDQIPRCSSGRIRHPIIPLRWTGRQTDNAIKGIKNSLRRLINPRASGLLQKSTRRLSTKAEKTKQAVDQQ